MFPFAPPIATTRPVFVDKTAGIVKAGKYMKCMIDYLKTVNNFDIFEET